MEHQETGGMFVFIVDCCRIIYIYVSGKKIQNSPFQARELQALLQLLEKKKKEIEKAVAECSRYNNIYIYIFFFC